MHDGHEHMHTHDSYSADELVALLRYLVKHNTEHTAELVSLAEQLGENEEARRLVEEAAADYAAGNAKLSKALLTLTGE